jgi:hypothetical protein
MAMTGLGMGILFPTMYVVAQTAVPPTHLGVGSAAVRSLGKIGGLVEIAIFGNVVRQSLSTVFPRRVPVAALTYVMPAGGTSGTETRVLLDPAYREAVVQRAIGDDATGVPIGPEHERVVASVAAQVQSLLSDAFEALRVSLAAAISGDSSSRSRSVERQSRQRSS